MKRLVLFCVVLCLCASPILAINAVRSIPLGSSGEYVREHEQGDFLREIEFTEIFEASVKIEHVKYLEFDDTFLGLPAQIGYCIWNDKVYEIQIKVLTSHLNEPQRDQVYILIDSTLEEKYGNIERHVGNSKFWDLEDIKISSSIDYNAQIIHYTDKAILNEMEVTARTFVVTGADLKDLEQL